MSVLTRKPQAWIEGMKEKGGITVWCRKFVYQIFFSYLEMLKQI